MLKRLITSSELQKLPELIVFDLDECLWHPEMYTLDEIPTRTVHGPLGREGDGVVGAISGSEQIRLFPDALGVLQAFYRDEYPGVRIAAASSADTPRAVQIGLAAMNLLEIVPGVTMRQVFNKGWEPGFNGNMQIGRTPPLSSDKSKTHFPILKQRTNIDYNGMIFFDDCNWGDHCGKVEKACHGVIAQRTPHGLTISEFNQALLRYSQHYSREGL